MITFCVPVRQFIRSLSAMLFLGSFVVTAQADMKSSYSIYYVCPCTISAAHSRNISSYPRIDYLYKHHFQSAGIFLFNDKAVLHYLTPEQNNQSVNNVTSGIYFVTSADIEEQRVCDIKDFSSDLPDYQVLINGVVGERRAINVACVLMSESVGLIASALTNNSWINGVNRNQDCTVNLSGMCTESEVYVCINGVPVWWFRKTTSSNIEDEGEVTPIFSVLSGNHPNLFKQNSGGYDAYIF